MRQATKQARKHSFCFAIAMARVRRRSTSAAPIAFRSHDAIPFRLAMHRPKSDDTMTALACITALVGLLARLPAHPGHAANALCRAWTGSFERLYADLPDDGYPWMLPIPFH